jgi:hypothetical protein
MKFLKVALALTLLLSLSTNFAQAQTPERFSFTGSGYGHGVGLSQIGAKARALAGESATAILNYSAHPRTLPQSSITLHIHDHYCTPQLLCTSTNTTSIPIHYSTTCSVREIPFIYSNNMREVKRCIFSLYSN